MESDQTIAEVSTTIFINCVFVLDFDPVISFREKQKWRQKITKNGGTVSYIVTKQVCTDAIETI